MPGPLLRLPPPLWGRPARALHARAGGGEFSCAVGKHPPPPPPPTRGGGAVPGTPPARGRVGTRAPRGDAGPRGAVHRPGAMGLTLIWGVMNVINLTHGAMIVLGMFGVYFLATAAGLSPYGGVPIVIVLGFLFGVVVYWISVNRVVGRPVLMSLL